MGSASVVEVAPRYDELLKGSNIKFIQSIVTSLNSTTGSMEYISVTNANNTLPINTKLQESSENVINSIPLQSKKFDQVIIGVGVQPRVDIIDGAKEHSLPFYRIEDAYQLRTKLKVIFTSLFQVSCDKSCRIFALRFYRLFPFKSYN